MSHNHQAHGHAFGDVLRRARAQAGKTQAKIAELAGLSTEFYSRMERGHGIGSLRTFSTLRPILKFDANELLASMGQRTRPLRRGRRKRQSARRLAQELRGPYKVFAHELREARARRDLMQSDVARAVGCTDGFYQRVEAGTQLPSIALLARMHQCLGFDANRLLDALHEDPPPRPRYYRLGSLIADARARAELSAVVAAQAAGCSLADYERIESGDMLPTLTGLARLHGLLGFNGDAALRRIRLCADDSALQ